MAGVTSGNKKSKKPAPNNVRNKEHYIHLRKQRQRKRSLRCAASVVLVLLIVCLGYVAALGFSAMSLKGQASSVVSELNSMKSSVSSGDYSGVAKSSEELAVVASEMSDTLSSPMWAIAELLPVFGDDVKAVRTLAVVLDDVSNNSILPIARALEASPPSSLLNDGRVDIDQLSTLTTAIRDAAPAIERGRVALDAMPQTHIDQLSSAIDSVVGMYYTIDEFFGLANELLPVLEDMLGANGPRNYLLVAQNSVETRATGGFPGSMGILAFDNGQISLKDFAAVYDVIDSQIPESVRSSETEVELFGYWVDELSANAGYNPDFRKGASVWAAAFEAKNGYAVDGVISVTPQVVQSVLGITGPIELSDGTCLDEDNATRILQSELYWKYLSNTAESVSEGNAIADALFSETASRAFDMLLDNMNSSTLVKFASVMLQSIEDREVMLWLMDSDLQKRIELIDCSGALNSDRLNPKLGTYFNVCAASKLGWYVDMETTISEGEKGADGMIRYQVSTTYINNVTEKEVTEGGRYIIGGSEGDLRAWVSIVAPAGGSITNFTTSNGAEFSEGTYQDLQVMCGHDLSIKPGESLTCTYIVEVSPEAESELGLISTPMLTKYREQG